MYFIYIHIHLRVCMYVWSVWLHSTHLPDRSWFLASSSRGVQFFYSGSGSDRLVGNRGSDELHGQMGDDDLHGNTRQVVANSTRAASCLLIDSCFHSDT